MRRTSLGITLLFGLTCLPLGLATAAKPKAKPNPKANPTQNQSSVDADKLTAGQFTGVLVNVPGNDRMFTLKITYPEVRLKPGAKMPNLQSMHSQGMNQILQQMHRSQQSRGGNRGYQHHRGGHYNAMSNMMHQQQMYMQGQQRMMQAMAQAEQKELQLLQKEYRAILNMYQVVQASSNFDFQLEGTVKVRILALPEQFDDKGNIKTYTAQEKAELKGKDKKLPGYESTLDALKVGQTIMVALRVHQKPKPAIKLTTAIPSDKDKDADAVKDKDTSKDADMDADTSPQHKMQVRVLVILKDSDAPPPSPSRKNKKKNK